MSGNLLPRIVSPQGLAPRDTCPRRALGQRARSQQTRHNQALALTRSRSPVSDLAAGQVSAITSLSLPIAGVLQLTSTLLPIIYSYMSAPAVMSPGLATEATVVASSSIPVNSTSSPTSYTTMGNVVSTAVVTPVGTVTFSVATATTTSRSPSRMGSFSGDSASTGVDFSKVSSPSSTRDHAATIATASTTAGMGSMSKIIRAIRSAPFTRSSSDSSVYHGAGIFVHSIAFPLVVVFGTIAVVLLAFTLYFGCRDRNAQVDVEKDGNVEPCTNNDDLDTIKDVGVLTLRDCAYSIAHVETLTAIPAAYFPETTFPVINHSERTSAQRARRFSPPGDVRRLVVANPTVENLSPEVDYPLGVSVMRTSTGSSSSRSCHTLKYHAEPSPTPAFNPTSATIPPSTAFAGRTHASSAALPFGSSYLPVGHHAESSPVHPSPQVLGIPLLVPSLSRASSTSAYSQESWLTVRSPLEPSHSSASAATPYPWTAPSMSTSDARLIRMLLTSSNRNHVAP